MQVAAAERQPAASIGGAGALAGSGGCEDSGARLVELARAQAPLRRTLAAIAGRLVATRAWERLGYARLRDYAVERAGISGRELQDLARVDRALGDLPGVENAFLAGLLSWTKARLVARVATREDEARWVAFAEPRTAREVAREVRAVDQRALENGGAAISGDNDRERRVGVISSSCTASQYTRHRPKILTCARSRQWPKHSTLPSGSATTRRGSSRLWSR